MKIPAFTATRGRVHREKMGITKEELARLSYISRSALANYESGLREPKGAIIVNIATALNTTTDYLLGRTETREALEMEVESALSGHSDLMGIWLEYKKPGGFAVPFQGSQTHDPGKCQKGNKNNKGIEVKKEG